MSSSSKNATSAASQSTSGARRAQPSTSANSSSNAQRSADKRAASGRGASTAVASSSANAANNQAAQQVGAVYLRRQDIDAFRYDYDNLLKEVNRVEATGDFATIVQANYAIYRFLSGYLDKVRKSAQRQKVSRSRAGAGDQASSDGADGSAGSGADDNVLVAVRDIRSLELEAEFRFLRAIFARNAMTSGLGNSVISAVGQQSFYRDLEKSLARLNEKGGGNEDEDDESNEEKNFSTVNLSKSDGLYSIRDTSEALSIENLVGYTAETNELLNYCRDVRLVLPSGDSGADDGLSVTRNPTCIVLYGPPGTGKTTVAQAVAKYLGYIYMYVNAENIISSWAGGTEKNIAKLFRRARIASLQNRGQKVLMLIDEIDGLLKNRATNPNLTGEEYNRITTFLQMLTPPVGVDNSRIVGIFTTNLLTNLEPAFVARCKGKIFMGYIVDPADRTTLLKQLISPWVYPRSNDPVWTNMGIILSDFVPRDFQNALSAVKNMILQKAQGNNAVRRDNNTGFEYVDLSNPSNLLDFSVFQEYILKAEPSTDTNSFFDFYTPPQSYVCRWLNLNGDYARGYSVFVEHENGTCQT